MFSNTTSGYPVRAGTGTKARLPPGLGQLAWQAALKRDLPLLINVTLLVSVFAGISGMAGEIARPRAVDGEKA